MEPGPRDVQLVINASNSICWHFVQPGTGRIRDRLFHPCIQIYFCKHGCVSVQGQTLCVVFSWRGILRIPDKPVFAAGHSAGTILVAHLQVFLSLILQMCLHIHEPLRNAS